MDPGVGVFEESGRESDQDLMDAYLEDLADRLVSQQGGDLGFVDGDSVSAALAALLGEQAVSLVGGSFDDTSMTHRWLSTTQPTLVFVAVTSR